MVLPKDSDQQSSINGGRTLEEPLLAAHNGEGSAAALCPGQGHSGHRSHWLQTVCTLLTLQLGWGLWLLPADFAHLGWVTGGGCLLALALLTVYSGFMFSRLYSAVPGTVLFGDIGHKAAGSLGRNVVYAVIYSLDATRCVILHLAASESLRHIFPEDASGSGMIGGQRPPLWQCGLVVLVLALVLGQIRSLARLSWFFLLGTGSQLLAVAVVVYQLVSEPDREAVTEYYRPLTMATLPSQVVALMNIIFAFGGQFAFVEIMTCMKRPACFPRAVTLCTVIMGCMYAGLGSVGYWSRGNKITDIIIFSLPAGPISQAAAAAILFQALAQYLVNLNVWTHNLLTLIARQRTPKATIVCASDHKAGTWFVASLFVLTYSYFISVSIPYFSPLVGLVTSVTYLSCAYTIPAWFSLCLVGPRLHAAERALLRALIPVSLALSAVGFYSSAMAMVDNVSGGGGEGGF
ncbi:MAG: hypothetical protein WDW36_000513 [Sanguina aurantia]